MAVIAAALAAVIGCGGVTPSSGQEEMPTIDPALAGSGIVAQSSTTVTRRPVSTFRLIVGVSYRYTVPTCEAEEPIDLDRSFWDASRDELARVAGMSGLFTLMAPNSAAFRSDGGGVAEFTRHDGFKEFAICGSR